MDLWVHIFSIQVLKYLKEKGACMHEDSKVKKGLGQSENEKGNGMQWIEGWSYKMGRILY